MNMMFDVNNPQRIPLSQLTPAGQYEAVITYSQCDGDDVKATLVLEIELTSSAYSGRIYTKTICFNDSVEICEKRGREELALLCNLIGITNLKHADELLGRKVSVIMSTHPDIYDEEERYIKHPAESFIKTFIGSSVHEDKNKNVNCEKLKNPLALNSLPRIDRHDDHLHTEKGSDHRSSELLWMLNAK